MSDRRYAPIGGDVGHWPDAENYLPRTVHEIDDSKPVFSGLYDMHGLRLYRMPAERRIGFIHHGSGTDE